MFITLLFYKLGKKEHAKVVEELAARSRAEGAYNLDEEIGKESIGAITEEEASVIMGNTAVSSHGFDRHTSKEKVDERDTENDISETEDDK